MNNPYLNKKYIIVSGCSYGHFATGIEYSIQKLRPIFLEETKESPDYNIFEVDDTHDDFINKTIFVNIQNGGQTSTYVVDSIIYTTEYLLSKGVQSKDIYVLAEYSNLERPTSYNHLYPESNFEMGIKEDEPKIINNSELFNDFNISWSKISMTAVYLNNLVYINGQGVNTFNPSNYNLKTYFDSINKWVLNTPIQNSIKDYLDTILRLQWYLESKTISYNCCSINSQFSHWIDLKETITRKSMLDAGNPYCRFKPPSELSKTKNLDYEEFYKSNEEDDLVSIYPPIKDIFNLIDLSKWWFYNTDIYRYGGIDEYTIDNHDWYGYSKSEHNTSTVYSNIPAYFNHPAIWVYVELWNKVTKHSDIKYTKKFIDWLSSNVKKYKDIVWNGGEVNNEFISTKYLDVDMFKNPKEVRLGKF